MTTPAPSPAASSAWPSLLYAAWQDTYATLHLWTQIVGKIRLLQMPWINHSWHVTLYPTARGLTTLPMPYVQRASAGDIDQRRRRTLDRAAAVRGCRVLWGTVRAARRPRYCCADSHYAERARRRHPFRSGLPPREL